MGPDGKTTVVAWNDDFTVNGVNIAMLSGDGWNYATNVLTISGASGIERYTLRGTNTLGEVRVVVSADSTVELAGVSLRSEEPLVLGEDVTATVAISGSGNRLVSTYSSNPGIRVPQGAALTITNATDDAYLYACANGWGSGIGERGNYPPGSITIAGGTVEAHCSETDTGSGAGIGGGNGAACGLVRITGGRVFAYGATDGSSRASAGIGGGVGMYNIYDARIEISGGTVYACGGRIDDTTFAADIGTGIFWSKDYYENIPVVITGGSVVPAHFDSEKQRFTQSMELEENLPHDAADRVLHAVVVPLGTPDAAVAGLVLPASAGSYGTRDLYADANGDLYLWLPDGDYSFTVNGRGCTATVDGADTVAVVDPAALDSLHIESIELVPGAVVLVVSAEPDGWLTSETAELLRVRVSETLPLPGGDAALLPRADVGVLVNDDGTATVVVPRAADVPRMFYRVEAP